MKKKRIIGIILILALLAALFACNGKDNPRVSDTTPPEDTVEETKSNPTPAVIEEADEPQKEEKQEEKKTENAPSTGVSPDFKAAMDSYEEFFDDYIAFMEEYENSDDSLSMMTDYLSYMQKYADTMQKLDDINEDSLSDADSLYYLEVQTRITQKLLTVAN